MPPIVFVLSPDQTTMDELPFSLTPFCWTAVSLCCSTTTARCRSQKTDAETPPDHQTLWFVINLICELEQKKLCLLMSVCSVMDSLLHACVCLNVPWTLCYVTFQIIFANLKTTSTTSTSHVSRSEIWRRERCCLRSPNLPTAVSDRWTSGT